MKVLIVGSGGREHTLAWKIHKSPHLTQLYCAPGNPGTAQLGDNIPIAASDLEGLLEFSQQNQIDLTVVGPEAPLVNGIVDRYEAVGLKVAGPSQNAAQLEGSKVFAKDFMQRHKIPTAHYQTYSSTSAAELALRRGEYKFPLVVKADGLAAGKGVLICQNLSESLDAVSLIMEKREFGKAGDRVVIEEFLEGEELSFIQDEIRPTGHAMECRIYAEDGFNHFIPSTGIITEMTVPSGLGIRMDEGVRAGQEITPYYDSLLGKLITWGNDRGTALRRMIRALGEFHIAGIESTIPFCLMVLRHKTFQKI